MEPTIGRIVYYHALNGETYPAIITRVHPTTVNLQVFYEDSVKAVTSVPQGEGDYTWDWMPFQKAQAK